MRLVCSLLVAIASTAASLDQTFRSRAEGVRVDVLVMQNGHPVRGLRAADFELRDEGVPQKIALADVDKIPLNVVLVLDSSASLEGQPMEYLRSAATGLLGALHSVDRAALVSFNEAVAIRAEPSIDRAPLLKALQTLEANGTTSLIDGVGAGLALSDPRGGRSLTVVFSDGVDTSSWLEATSVSKAAERADAVVYGVVTETARRDPFLPKLTAATGGRVLEIPSLDKLSDAFTSILDEFRTRYILAYTPADVPAGGWHRIEVRVKGRRVTVDARRGYFAAQ
jgi:Ca-activated chloride channel family protein